jgi:hypothetical protein
MLQIGDFVGELVAGATRAVPLRIASLDHEILDHPMKHEPVVEVLSGDPVGFERALRKPDEIGDRHRRLLVLEGAVMTNNRNMGVK